MSSFQRTTSLTRTQEERYQRHLQLQTIGVAGQITLLNTRILCIGAGGLGSALLLYLQAAGIGCIGIMDGDAVSLSNLQRQVLYDHHQIGMNKALTAKENLQKKNPDTHILAIPEYLTPENAETAMADYDLIVDCCDNLKTRYLINDTCYRLNKTFFFASVNNFEGMLSIFKPGNPGCFRCLFPEPTQAHSSPNGLGILGVLPGIIGLLQTNEILKYILSIGISQPSRITHFDTLTQKMKQLHLSKQTDCNICSATPA